MSEPMTYAEAVDVAKRALEITSMHAMNDSGYETEEVEEALRVLEEGPER